jgi:AcrR family transcriptional regulator
VAKRAELSEQRKNEILDAALEVFSEVGLGEASVDDVVKRSGLSKGTLYWYFKSKDRLVGALMRRFFTRELERVRSLKEDIGPVRDRLLRYVHEIVTEMKLMPRALTFEFYAVAIRQKSIRKFMGQLYVQYCEELAAVIREGISQGEFRQTDAGKLAAAMTGLCEGLILLWAINPEAFPFGDLLERSVKIVLEGVRPEEQGSR